MEDLEILPEHLSTAARVVGEDFCWPVHMAADVVNALAASERAILGLEQWRFEGEDLRPIVISFLSYRVDEQMPWRFAVAKTRDEALKDLERFQRDKGDWCQIEWASESELRARH